MDRTACEMGPLGGGLISDESWGGTRAVIFMTSGCMVCVRLQITCVSGSRVCCVGELPQLRGGLGSARCESGVVWSGLCIALKLRTDRLALLCQSAQYSSPRSQMIDL